jgi:putative thiazole/oxazole-modified microcin (TOMM)-like peptide
MDMSLATAGNGTGDGWLHDVRFAELMVRAFLDPSTAERYTTSPREVLGEFGITIDAGVATPALPEVRDLDTVREDFCDIGPAGTCLLTFSIASETETWQTAVDAVPAGR